MQVVHSVWIHAGDTFEEFYWHIPLEVFFILFFIFTQFSICFTHLSSSRNLLQVRVTVLVMRQVLEASEYLSCVFWWAWPDDLELLEVDCEQSQLWYNARWTNITACVSMRRTISYKATTSCWPILVLQLEVDTFVKLNQQDWLIKISIHVRNLLQKTSTFKGFKEIISADSFLFNTYLIR